MLGTDSFLQYGVLMCVVSAQFLPASDTVSEMSLAPRPVAVSAGLTDVTRGHMSIAMFGLVVGTRRAVLGADWLIAGLTP